MNKKGLKKQSKSFFIILGIILIVLIGTFFALDRFGILTIIPSSSEYLSYDELSGAERDFLKPMLLEIRELSTYKPLVSPLKYEIVGKTQIDCFLISGGITYDIKVGNFIEGNDIVRIFDGRPELPLERTVYTVANGCYQYYKDLDIWKLVREGVLKETIYSCPTGVMEVAGGYKCEKLCRMGETICVGNDLHECSKDGMTLIGTTCPIKCEDTIIGGPICVYEGTFCKVGQSIIHSLFTYTCIKDGTQIEKKPFELEIDLPSSFTYRETFNIGIQIPELTNVPIKVTLQDSTGNILGIYSGRTPTITIKEPKALGNVDIVIEATYLGDTITETKFVYFSDKPDKPISLAFILAIAFTILIISGIIFLIFFRKKR